MDEMVIIQHDSEALLRKRDLIEQRDKDGLDLNLLGGLDKARQLLVDSDVDRVKTGDEICQKATDIVVAFIQ
jgi:hypothetical protein